MTDDTCPNPSAPSSLVEIGKAVAVMQSQQKSMEARLDHRSKRADGQAAALRNWILGSLGMVAAALIWIGKITENTSLRVERLEQDAAIPRLTLAEYADREAARAELIDQKLQLLLSGMSKRDQETSDLRETMFQVRSDITNLINRVGQMERALDEMPH